MPKKRKKKQFKCENYTWLLGVRNDVWTADGRSNKVDLGRHSLGTRDYEKAISRLHKLDRKTAFDHGLIGQIDPVDPVSDELPIQLGIELYLEHANRPRVLGGIRPSSLKRYRAVFDKFQRFTESKKIDTWNRVDTKSLTMYAKFLETKGYAYRSQYLEINTVKQAIRWLIEAGNLSADCRIRLSLRKPKGTSTYCWSVIEVRSMVDHCRKRSELNWLGDVIIALSTSGLRISELIDLKWIDLDLEQGMLLLQDETSRSRGKSVVRTTKSEYDRSFPIHSYFKAVLEKLSHHRDGYVFHGPRSGRLKADTVRRILVRDVTSELETKFPTAEGTIGFCHGRLHSFRHFFCSFCSNRGVPIQTVMLWLGHRASEMVQHYYHINDAEAHRHMGRLDFFSEEDGDGHLPEEK